MRQVVVIMPSRSHWCTGVPTRWSVTMRLAMSPAICRTSTLPVGAASPTEACSFDKLAFSAPACPNAPAL